MIAKEVLDDPRELWLNSPIGYPYVERIAKHEESRLKGFMISTMGMGDDVIGDQIRGASLEQVVQTFLDNNFTFDETWFGVRDIPLGPSGQPLSRLDDPEYRRNKGIGYG